MIYADGSDAGPIGGPAVPYAGRVVVCDGDPSELWLRPLSGLVAGDDKIPDRSFRCRRLSPLARLALALGALQLGDVVTTFLVLRSGVGVEGNGVAAALLSIGLWGFLLILLLKVGVVAAFYLRGMALPDRHRRVGWAVAALYAAVLGWNLAVLIGRGGL